MFLFHANTRNDTQTLSRLLASQPNKSLDRSGGGVFCNLIDAVKVG